MLRLPTTRILLFAISISLDIYKAVSSRGQGDSRPLAEREVSSLFLFFSLPPKAAKKDF